MQISFITLLLGLISGVQTVEVSVPSQVAAVELRLDGAPVATLDGPPWVQRVDFGAGLLPHVLEARALDAGGAELARTRQWVNLPRPPAEVTVALEGGPAGAPAFARLAWQSLIAGDPTQVSLTLDGRPLVLDRDRRAALPSLSLETPHVLTAEVEFGPGLSARRDIVLAAESGDASGELTAVPVRRTGRRPVPSPKALQGWFAAGSQPLRVLAVEEQPRQLMVVRDPGSQRPMALLSPPSLRAGNPLLARMKLGRDTLIRLLCANPRSRAVEGAKADLFDSSRDFNANETGLHRLLNEVTFPGRDEGGQRLADAVAVAGLQAFQGSHPRAVLLVLGPQPADASLYTPAAVRRYLEALRVPLHVWSLVPPPLQTAAMTAWGKVEDVSTPDRLAAAIGRLREDLESQRVVFVEGLHLPQSIELTSAAQGMELP